MVVEWVDGCGVGRWLWGGEWLWDGRVDGCEAVPLYSHHPSPTHPLPGQSG